MFKETEEKAKAVAKIIIQEMSFPAPIRTNDKTMLTQRLLDGVPTRADLSFQQRGHQPTAKSTLSPELADDEELKNLFCIAHGEFVRSSGMDIEHAFSFDAIRNKQLQLLTFLDNNQEFANVFLNQPNIEDYFRRDPRDLKIKGTAYFFKLCYNDIGNLLLLCHACNIHKSDKDPLTWFEEQDTYFGKPFVEAVKATGGLHKGLSRNNFSFLN